MLMNIRSKRANFTLINSFLIDNTFPDIICFTETWLSEFYSAIISDIPGDKYSFLHSPRYFDNIGDSVDCGIGCFIGCILFLYFL